MRIHIAVLLTVGLLFGQTFGAETEAPVKGRVLIVRDGAIVTSAGKKFSLGKGKTYQAVAVPSANGFEYEVTFVGGSGKLAKHAAAFAAGNGPFKMSLLSGVEAGLLKLEGTGESQGEAVRVKAKWDPALAPKLCFANDAALLLEPDPPYQDVVTLPKMAKPWKPSDEQAPEGDRREIQVEVNDADGVMIEGYCADADMQPPENGVVFKSTKAAPPHLAEVMAKLVGQLVNHDQFQELIWDAEARAISGQLGAGDWIERTSQREEGKILYTYAFPEEITFDVYHPAAANQIPEDERAGRQIAEDRGAVILSDSAHGVGLARRLAGALIGEAALPRNVAMRTELNTRNYLARHTMAELREWLEENDVALAHVSEQALASKPIIVVDADHEDNVRTNLNSR
jgi:hypothetical protein